jgi:hypothetical protein
MVEKIHNRDLWSKVTGTAKVRNVADRRSKDARRRREKRKPSRQKEEGSENRYPQSEAGALAERDEKAHERANAQDRRKGGRIDIQA